jgi:hypothetical protein
MLVWMRMLAHMGKSTEGGVMLNELDQASCSAQGRCSPDTMCCGQARQRQVRLLQHVPTGTQYCHMDAL